LQRSGQRRGTTATTGFAIAAVRCWRIRRVTGLVLALHPIESVVMGMQGGVRRGRTCCRYRCAIQNQGQHEQNVQ